MDINDYFNKESQMSEEEKKKILEDNLGMKEEELDNLPLSDKQLIVAQLFGQLDEKRLEQEKQLIDGLVTICSNNAKELKSIIEPIIREMIETYALTCSQYGYVNGQYSILQTAWSRKKED